LSALASGLILGLTGGALGAYGLLSGFRLLRWHDFTLMALVFSVSGAFFSFVIGGWVAAKVAGIGHSEPAALHGAIVWLIVVPIMLVLAALGAGVFFGPGFAWLAGSPAWIATPPPSPDANAILAARNAAMGALLALVVGLAGSVLGGWLASGEPMTWRFDRTRAARQSAGSTQRRGDEQRWR
jgi:uncharacterized membrane protein YeaQ/YmgE (transglycosylase-associated protein family)